MTCDNRHCDSRTAKFHEINESVVGLPAQNQQFVLSYTAKHAGDGKERHPKRRPPLMKVDHNTISPPPYTRGMPPEYTLELSHHYPGLPGIFPVHGLWFMVHGSGFRVQGSGSEISN